MGRRVVEQHHIRSITRSGGGSYGITLPIEIIRALQWQERQKVVVRSVGKKIIIDDWEAKNFKSRQSV
jgi:antitoxin component of MazEF toxin-antitoxin module